MFPLLQLGIFGSASVFVKVHVLKSLDVATGMFARPLAVPKAYQVFPTWMKAGSGKLLPMTGPLENERLGVGVCEEKATRDDSKRRDRYSMLGEIFDRAVTY